MELERRSIRIEVTKVNEETFEAVAHWEMASAKVRAESAGVALVLAAGEIAEQMGDPVLGRYGIVSD